MTNLLIHSMSAFKDIILPAFDIAGARGIAEIGAEFGGNSFVLADYAADQCGYFLSIDPAPKAEFLKWVASADHVVHIPLPSLEAIPQLAPVDSWVIDGDHNWYTVLNELKLIRQASAANGKPMLIFFHDIHWPCGRRDSYYAPERIPVQYRQPYSFEGGCTPGHSQLRSGRGFRGMGQFAWANHEGGPRNGVLTAIEDFMAEELEHGREYGFAEIPGVFGLGVLFALDADWSAAMAAHLAPLHQHGLLAALEANRLANYCHVLELQDNEAAAIAAE